MFIVAVSPVFGFHVIIGWGSSLILLVVLLDKKAGFWAAIRKPWEKGQRFFACYLLLLIIVSVLVNLFVTWTQMARLST